MKKLNLDVNDINLDITLFGGQCFNWTKVDNNTYYGIFSDRVIKLVNKNSNLYWEDNIGNDQNFIENYFDININYENIKAKLKNFEEIHKIINKIGTIRILNQELEQTIISFIISQNNNITRIKKILSNLAIITQKEVFFDNNKFYLFPTIKELKNISAKNLEALKAGYRTKYIQNLNEEYNKIQKIKSYKSLIKQRKILKSILGIGDKVADCILVFSLKHRNITPIDTWIKKYYQNFDNTKKLSYQKIAKNFTKKFKNLTAYAGQYIFEFERIKKVL